MKSKEIIKPEEIEEIIRNSDVCYIGFSDGEEPYVLPFNFGYTEDTVWLHSGPGGKKHDFIKKNNKVCIVFSSHHDLHFHHKTVACSYSMRFKSVVAYGTIEYVEEYEEKVKALDVIMKQYVKRDFTYSEPSVKNVCVFKVKLTEKTGKMRGYV
ncbi:MAG: MFS transporter [Marinilabiliales bacterium]|nr:MAG: MFS transporter [Marinilabiliales bacterium]